MNRLRGRMTGPRPRPNCVLRQFTCPPQPEVVDPPTADLRSEVRGLPVSFSRSVVVRQSPSCRGPAGAASRRDRHLDHAITLVREQLVGFTDPVEREAMGDERAKIELA
jgi:hypothetical protein